MTMGAIFLLLGSLVGNGIFISRNKKLGAERDRLVLQADSMLAVKLMLDKECDDTKASLAKVKGENAELDNTIRALNSALNEMKLQNEKLGKENAGINTLRKQLAEVKKKRKECDKHLAAAMSEIESLAVKYKETSKSYAELNGQLALLNGMLEKARELTMHATL